MRIFCWFFCWKQAGFGGFYPNFNDYIWTWRGKFGLDAKFFLKLGLIVVQIPFFPFFVVLSKVFCVGYLLSQFLIFLLTCNCQLPLYPTFCSTGEHSFMLVAWKFVWVSRVLKDLNQLPKPGWGNRLGLQIYTSTEPFAQGKSLGFGTRQNLGRLQCHQLQFVGPWCTAGFRSLGDAVWLYWMES